MVIAKKTLRTSIVVLGAVAAVLLCAIGVVAVAKGRSTAGAATAASDNPSQQASIDANRIQADKDAAAEAQKKADAQKKIEARLDALEDENSDLKEKAKAASISLVDQAKKLAVAEQEAARLRQQLESEEKDAAEISKKYEDTQAELSKLLAKQIKDPVPIAGNADAVKAKVAKSGNGKARRHNNNNYNRDVSSNLPSSTKKHDPGVGPRLADKDDDASTTYAP